jgi:hypothetical protein
MGQVYWNTQQASDELVEDVSFTVCRGRTIRYRQDGFWLLARGGVRILGRDIGMIAGRLKRVRS